jgi:hypothetical protein
LAAAFYFRFVPPSRRSEPFTFEAAVWNRYQAERAHLARVLRIYVSLPLSSRHSIYFWKIGFLSVGGASVD